MSTHKVLRNDTYSCFSCNAVVGASDGVCPHCGKFFGATLLPGTQSKSQTGQAARPRFSARNIVVKTWAAVAAMFMLYFGGTMTWSALNIVLAGVGVIRAGERDVRRLAGGVLWGIVLGTIGLVLIGLGAMAGIWAWTIETRRRA